MIAVVYFAGMTVLLALQGFVHSSVMDSDCTGTRKAAWSGGCTGLTAGLWVHALLELLGG